MSEHEAARTPGDRTKGGDARPGASRDERPRPQYGEYAPEGWTWQPPAGEHTSDPAPQLPEPPVAASVAGRPDRPADRIVTILLLVLGVFGVFTTIATLQALPEQLPRAIQQAAEMLGTSGATLDYTPGPEVPGLLLAGSIAQIVLWLLIAWWSVARLRARRLAFWVPLIGGAVSFVLLYAVMFIVVMSDPALMDALSGA